MFCRLTKSFSHLSQGSGSRAKPSPHPVFVNKLLLGHSHAQIIYGCFHTPTPDSRNYDSRCISHKFENIYYPALCKTCLLVSDLSQWSQHFILLSVKKIKHTLPSSPFLPGLICTHEASSNATLLCDVLPDIMKVNWKELFPCVGSLLSFQIFAIYCLNIVIRASSCLPYYVMFVESKMLSTFFSSPYPRALHKLGT